MNKDAPSFQPTGRKIIDVTHPGQSAPDASARPLIVTHRPIVQDPMMLPKSDKPDTASNLLPDTPPAPPAHPTLTQSKTVLPPSVDEPKPKQDKPPTDELSTSNDTVTSAFSERIKPESDSDASDNSDNSDSDEPTLAETEQTKHEAEATARATAASEELIASQKYFVPISSGQKHTMRLAVIGAVLIILVALGCLDAMLDAGLINLPHVPHTNFIKND